MISGFVLDVVRKPPRFVACRRTRRLQALCTCLGTAIPAFGQRSQSMVVSFDDHVGVATASQVATCQCRHRGLCPTNTRPVVLPSRTWRSCSRRLAPQHVHTDDIVIFLGRVPLCRDRRTAELPVLKLTAEVRRVYFLLRHERHPPQSSARK